MFLLLRIFIFSASKLCISNSITDFKYSSQIHSIYIWNYVIFCFLFFTHCSFSLFIACDISWFFSLHFCSFLLCQKKSSFYIVCYTFMYFVLLYLFIYALGLFKWFRFFYVILIWQIFFIVYKYLLVVLVIY